MTELEGFLKCTVLRVGRIAPLAPQAPHINLAKYIWTYRTKVPERVFELGLGVSCPLVKGKILHNSSRCNLRSSRDRPLNWICYVNTPARARLSNIKYKRWRALRIMHDAGTYLGGDGENTRCTETEKRCKNFHASAPLCFSALIPFRAWEGLVALLLLPSRCSVGVAL